MPDVGLSSRAMARSSVDLPQPLGPIDRGDLAVGDGEVEVAHDRRAAVPDGDGLGAPRRLRAWSCGDLRLVRTSSQIRYGAPIADGDQPGGEREREQTRVTRSAPTTRQPPQTIEASIGGREPPVRRSAICGTTNATNSSGPTAATANAARPTRRPGPAAG